MVGGGPTPFEELLACGAKEPCDQVSKGQAECPTLTVDSLVCLLEHLRDRVLGRYLYSSSSCSAVGNATSNTAIVVREDGTVVSAGCGSGFTSPYTCESARECTLPEAEALEDCLATQGDWDGFNHPACAATNQLLLNCTEAPPSCG